METMKCTNNDMKGKRKPLRMRKETTKLRNKFSFEEQLVDFTMHSSRSQEPDSAEYFP